jgi:hypothetical protein
MKKLVYVAGPFSPSNGKEMEKNTEFAERVGRYAQSLGYAPVVPHSSILRQVYGDDSIKQDRLEGTLSTLAVMMAVMDTEDSELWVIKNEDGKMSEGTYEEWSIWMENRGSRSMRLLEASLWEKEMEKFYLDQLIEATINSKEDPWNLERY